MLAGALRLLHEQDHVFLAGNATTAIYLTLKALDLRRKRVGLPENVCPSIPMAVSYSGNVPDFIDIDAETLALSLDDLRRRIHYLDALIAVYPYGWTIDIDTVRRLCADHDVFLIEDCAVAQGARIGNVPAGSVGDACIVSFGTGKIIDAGHGGAVLTNDRRLFDEIRKQGDRLPEHTPDNDRCLHHLSRFYNELYNRHFMHHKPALSRFRECALSVKDRCLYKFDVRFEAQIAVQLGCLRENVARRKRLARAFESRFSALQLPQVELCSPPAGSVYWRFNLMVSDIRDDLLFHLLAQGYRISSWYPSVRLFWESAGGAAKATVCDKVADSILNLWVNQDVDDAYVDEVSLQIARFASGAYQ